MTFKVRVREASTPKNEVQQLFLDMSKDYPCHPIMDSSHTEYRGIEFHDQYNTRVTYIGRHLKFIFDRDEFENDDSALDHAEALTKYAPMKIKRVGETVHFDAPTIAPDQAVATIKDYFEVD